MPNVVVGFSLFFSLLLSYEKNEMGICWILQTGRNLSNVELAHLMLNHFAAVNGVIPMHRLECSELGAWDLCSSKERLRTRNLKKWSTRSSLPSCKRPPGSHLLINGSCYRRAEGYGDPQGELWGWRCMRPQSSCCLFMTGSVLVNLWHKIDNNIQKWFAVCWSFIGGV